MNPQRLSLPTADYFVVRSESFEEDLAAMRDGEADAVRLWDWHYDGRSVELLASVPTLRHVAVQWSRALPFELDCLAEAVPNMVSLLVGVPKPRIDISRFERLRGFRGVWAPGVRVADTKARLVHLMLRGFRPKQRTLHSIGELASLQFLELVQGGFDSLDGLAELQHLESMELHYNRSLSSLAALAAPGWRSLRRLQIEYTSGIEDYDPLRHLTQLDALTIKRSAPIASIDFLRGMTALGRIDLSFTRIEDGDMRPLLERRWRSVRFTSRREYTHTCPEVVKAVVDFSPN
jgi:hypothetical protein